MSKQSTFFPKEVFNVADTVSMPSNNIYRTVALKKISRGLPWQSSG